MACSEWPESKTFGCSDSGDSDRDRTSWEHLDFSMDTSSTTSCEFLCRLKGEDGCCYITDDTSNYPPGCWWRAGSQASEEEKGSSHQYYKRGIAITCTEIGMITQIDQFSINHRQIV